jgi:hypothetical protein
MTARFEKEIKDKEARMIRQPYTGDFGASGDGEAGFTFPLTTRVQGLNSRGQEFTEDTVLSSISHQGSTFYLKNRINVGERLRLIIDLPEKLSPGSDLKLVIKGKVTQVEAAYAKATAQKVVVAFDSKYIIKPDA